MIETAHKKTEDEVMDEEFQDTKTHFDHTISAKELGKVKEFFDRFKVSIKVANACRTTKRTGLQPASCLSSTESSLRFTSSQFHCTPRTFLR